MNRYLTPLRYPGGKQRLAQFLAEIIKENDLCAGSYAEPYAGGAGAAIELLERGHVNSIHLNDSCLPVYAFWKAVLFFTDELCHLVATAPLNVDFWKSRRAILRDPRGFDELEIGFAALYLNRCNRSGVLSGGLIGGLQQNGKWLMDARFPRAALIERIRKIAEFSDRIVLRNWDAEYFIREHISALPDQTLVYLDPPYYDRHGRLYLDRYRRQDHLRLSVFIQTELHHRWILSYDAHPEVLSLYRPLRRFAYDLQYSAARSYMGREALIVSEDLKLPKSPSLALDPWLDGRSSD
jgi:DNA adenine methylase